MDILKISSILNNEYRRSSLATTLTEIIRFVGYYVMNSFDTQSYQMMSKNQLIFIYSILMTIINYTLDIFIAKDNVSSCSQFTWYLESFRNNHFLKFIIVMTIHYINNHFVLQYLKNVLNKHDILKTFKHRDIILQLIVNMLSFTLYIYFLKFKWAYIDTSDTPEITFIILSWSSILLILYMMNTNKSL